ncbi:MAG TPA: pyridoxamine 5'-phosphate oxidase [Candidatus Dormibacteraeota bacterium]
MIEAELDPDPVAQFGAWFQQAVERGVAQAEAMAVATAGADGAPSVRMVLLKEWGPEGFVFYTDYGSRKGAELAANPRAALLFFWQPVGRQVRIEGPVERVGQEASRRYFQTRPLRSQVAASISQQSQPVATRAELEAAFEARLAEAGEGPLELPARWGGFRVGPESFEFWQHQDDRLHDRIRYERSDAGWRMSRLSP